MDNLRECYRLLEVDPGASPEEVKRAYRDLVKVWHPDRFTDDPRLQSRAQEKLKQINLAYGKTQEARVILTPPPPPAAASPPPPPAAAWRRPAPPAWTPYDIIIAIFYAAIRRRRPAPPAWAPPDAVPPGDESEPPGAGAPLRRTRNWGPVLARTGISFIIVFQLTVVAAILWVITAALSVHPW